MQSRTISDIGKLAVTRYGLLRGTLYGAAPSCRIRSGWQCTTQLGAARFREGGLPEAVGAAFVSGGPWHLPSMRLALLVSILLLAGCAAGPVQPAMDYPPGAFYDCGGQPEVRPCMAGALLCSPPGG